MASLLEKIENSLHVLRSLLDGHDPERIVVAWTGGKDSTVVLDLWRGVLGQGPCEKNAAPVVLNLDTGHKFPEIIAFRDHWAARWNLRLTVAAPEPGDVPPVAAQNKLTCCRALKVLPLAKALDRLGARALLTGIRADENPARKDLALSESRGSHLQVNPILHWTEMDVWTYTTQRGLPYCTLYDQGYRSLGCMPCTARAAVGGERAGRDREKEAGMDQLRALGYF